MMGIHGASSSKTHPLGGDYNGGGKKQKGNGYQVFLSFREKDTGKGFTDYLYTSISDAEIRVSKDDNELGNGPELLSRIKHSRISIPIISENYTSSNRCLNELALMLECKRNRGQIVLPIFYKVAPLQMEHLKEKLGDIKDAEEENLDESVVKGWKEALEEVSSLKAWESENSYKGYEGKLVKAVVNRVKNELEKTVQPIVPIELVGIDDHLEKIMSWTRDEYNGTRIIGIYGMSGIGKTTLAKAVYDDCSFRFKYLSFVANIRETSQHKGVECLQMQLIEDILRSPKDVSTVEEGIHVIKSRFTNKQVLILLDDMDDHTHLDALVGDGSWFKAGSIVIITTRNESILKEAMGHYKYPLEELRSNQASILFNRHAFRKDSLSIFEWMISSNIISCIGRLPLTLEVIGSFLRGKKPNIWKDISKKLKKERNSTVQEKLRIVYETLNYGEKEIFLDIACFFSGLSKGSPTYMWDACNFLRGRIEESSLMYMIKIDEYGKLMMHDQLRDLGRKIVHLENRKKPQERSRLWNYEEAADVLDSNKGSTKIEALCLGKYGRGRSYEAERFKELTNLRFLQVNGVNFTGDFQSLLPKLRWLQWQDCPSEFAATNFHPKNLVMLDLSWSGISEEWGGWGPLKIATQLKVLNLTGCLSLKSTPDLSAFKSLEVLILEKCQNLEKIHPSIGDLKTLISLDVSSCGRLKELPAKVDCLMKLETLCASYCEELAQLPKSIGSLTALTQLDLSHSGIEELPESMGSLESLTQLDLSHSGIEELPESMGSLESLTQLDLSHSGIVEFPVSMGFFTSLTKLDLSHTGIKVLPESIGSLKKLQTLHASWCGLVGVPESIGQLIFLSLLDLRQCKKLEALPKTIGSLKSLRCLLLRGCCSLRNLPNSIRNMTSLTELDINSTAIQKLPYTMQNLQNLRILNVGGTDIKDLRDRLADIAQKGRGMWEE